MTDCLYDFLSVFLSICLSVSSCRPVCMLVYLLVFLSACLSVNISICVFLTVYINVFLFMTVSPQATSFKINIADDHATISCYEMHFSNDEAFNTFVSNYRFFLMMFR